MGSGSRRDNRALKEGCIRDVFLKQFGKQIEEFESFRNAVQGLRKPTYVSYRRVLPNYFLFLNQNPDEVITQRKLDIASEDVQQNERYERLTSSYIQGLIEKGLVGNTITNHLSRAQGFYSNNGHRLALVMRKLKLPKARRTEKFSPNNLQVRNLFGSADSARDKLIIALMYHHGPTPVDVSKLCGGEYPSEPWQYFEKSRSKTGEVWRGISTPDVCECMAAYLKVRGPCKQGERLFIGREGVLVPKSVSALVHDLIVKCEYNKIKGFKPTSLRDAFEDALVECETYAKEKEALMGHVSSIQHEYGGHNQMMSRLVKAMQKVYPLICLNDANKKDSSGAFSKEYIESVNTFMAEMRELKASIEAGQAIIINNPEAIEKLRKLGVL